MVSLAPARAESAAHLVAPAELSRYAIPVEAATIAVADSFAENACHWTAKRCGHAAVVDGRAGSPSLACAIEVSGGATCWSMADIGLFASGAQLVQPASGSDYLGVAVGRAQICLLDRDGALSCLHYAWDSANDTWLFTAPVARPGRFRAIAAGGGTFCATDQGGDVSCWPDGGECRNLNEATTPQPISLSCDDAGAGEVVAGAAGSTEVVVSVGGGCAVREDNRLLCWGEHARAAAATPSEATSMAQIGKTRAVTVTWSRACALRTSGTLVCWPTRGAGASAGVEPVAAVREAVAIAARGETLCWVDSSAAVFCSSAGDAPDLLATDAAQMELGEQLCVRFADGAVSCWAEPFRRRCRQGETVVSTYLTLAVGGGLVTDNRAGLFDLGLRGHVLFGPGLAISGQAKHQAWGLGAVAEVRSRSFETIEPAAGVELHSVLAERGPWLEVAVLGGYAFRPHRPEPVVGVTAAVLAIGPVSRGHGFVQGYWLRNFLIGLYVGARHGITYGRTELTAGLEVEILAPWAALDN